MIKLTKGQSAVLVLTALPMAMVGVAGGVATYVNMRNVIGRDASALGLVAAGEGATLIAALVALAVTLMGQHTPAVVRLAMWLTPLVAAAAGVALAPNRNEAVIMGVTPLAMTAAGEGIAFVARRVVAYRTGVDIEQQRRSGLLLWHANRAVNGSKLGKKLSKAAVWRLSKQFASTDNDLSVQLGGIQRSRISEGADVNLARVLSGTVVSPSESPAELPAPPRPVAGSEDLSGLPVLPELPLMPTPPALPELAPVIEARPSLVKNAVSEQRQGLAPQPEPVIAETAAEAGGLPEWMQEALSEAETRVANDPSVKLLSVADVAALKGVATGTVRSWKHRGNLRVHDMVDGKPMFHPTDVAKLD